MNDHRLESVRVKLGVALIYLSRARRRHVRDEDLADASSALEAARSLLGEPHDEGDLDPV